MMEVEIKPTNERECTNLLPLVLCFALLVTGIGVALVYGENDDNLKIIHTSAVNTTISPIIVSSTTLKPVTTQSTKIINEPTSTLLTPTATNTPEITTKKILESTLNPLTSETSTTTSNTPKPQDLDENLIQAIPETSTAAKTEVTTENPHDSTTKIIKIPQTMTTSTTEHSGFNPDTTTPAHTQLSTTTTLKPEIIAQTPSILPKVELTTKSETISIKMTSSESSTKHELIPTPQPFRFIRNRRRHRRNANIIDTKSIKMQPTTMLPTSSSPSIPNSALESITILDIKDLTSTSIQSSTPATTTLENLPTTTLAPNLVTVKLKPGDPTLKPQNGLNFVELTTKGMDATTSTQMNLPTTSIGMETTTKTSFKSTTKPPTTIAPTTTSTDLPSTFKPVPNQTSKEIAWHLVASMSFVSLIFSFIFLILFGRSAKSVIWIINAALVIFFCSFAGLSEMADYRIVAILSLATGIVLLILMFWYRVRINAVAKFLKECCVVFVDVPGLKFDSIATIITITISFIIFYKFFKSIPFNTSNEPQLFPLFIVILTFIWTTQFALSCQHFIVSGAVLRWYFNRDKTKVKNPVKSSVFHLIRFHLGSACLGSLLIVFGKIFRVLLFPFRVTEGSQPNFITNITSCCCVKPVKAFDEVTQYLAPRAYVFVAKEGTAFLKAGKLAYNFVSQRVMDIVALTHYGDLAMFACKILIAIISAVVSYPAIFIKTDQQYSRQISLTIGGIFAFFIAHCVLMLIEVTADTILVCFCIDCENNNGVSSSYFMSNELMKSIKDMKECIGGSLNFESQGMASGSSVPMLSHHGQKKNSKKRKASGGVSRMYN